MPVAEKKINLGIGVGRRTRGCETERLHVPVCVIRAQCSTKSAGPRKCSYVETRLQ